mgnify:CR=1 FL=1
MHIPTRDGVRCGAVIFTKHKKHIVVVQNKYLLDENQVISWGLPKGGVHKNESYVNCARREIKEETGLDIKIPENTPFIKIRYTYYYPVYLSVTADELQKIVFPKDTVEISKVSVCNIDTLKKRPSLLNYELRSLIFSYVPRMLHLMGEPVTFVQCSRGNDSPRNDKKIIVDNCGNCGSRSVWSHPRKRMRLDGDRVAHARKCCTPATSSVWGGCQTRRKRQRFTTLQSIHDNKKGRSNVDTWRRVH